MENQKNEETKGEISGAHPEMTSAPENYFFLMNVGRLIDAPSYTFGPGYELRRAIPSRLRKSWPSSMTPGALDADARAGRSRVTGSRG